MLKIGERIKSLRRERDITQDKLAAYLNISYQAVSKWENGTALPDITLIPGIANFFGVSADELLGMKENEETEELKEYERIYQENNRLGKTFDNITLSREVLSKYPRNYQWMLNLAYPLTHYEDNEEHYNYSKEHNFCSEAIGLCERILEDCTIDSIRHSAIQILSTQYPRIGKRDLALKLVNEMPDMYACRERLLANIYEGEKQIQRHQQNLLEGIELCAGTIYTLMLDNLMGKELTSLQKIECFETANGLIRLILKNDEDTASHNTTLFFNYLRISELWCELGDADKGMENLLLAAKAAKIYDMWASSLKKAKYKSMLVNRCVSNPMGVGKNYEDKETDILLQYLENKSFDIIRETETFRKLQQQLQ